MTNTWWLSLSLTFIARTWYRGLPTNLATMSQLYTISTSNIFASFHLKCIVPTWSTILLIAYGYSFIESNLGKYNLSKLTNTTTNSRLIIIALQTYFHALRLLESIRSQLWYEIRLQLQWLNLMGRNFVVFLWSPKEEPIHTINDTIHSTCPQIHPRDQQKKKYILTHQPKCHIRH